LVIVSFSVKISSQEVAVLKYNGGGDWYSNQTAVPNLIKFANKNSNTKIKLNQSTVAVGSIDLFNFPIVFMTGHGNVFFTEQEAQNLRNYLTSGGFLHVSDNYGGLFFEGRLVCFYDYESDLSDGWEDSSIHNNPQNIRLKALKMGSNIIEYAFKN